MSDVAVRADGLGKTYRYSARLAGDNLYDEVRDSWRRRISPVASGTDERFWAVRDVSFELARGEILGILGRNGSGKTTLLKLLARVTAPTTGRAEIHGRVAALLGTGIGFHPQLTGRDNISLSCTIVGMRPEEIEERFDAIAAFAEVGRFLDEPVKSYSTGMYARLAFSTAAHLPSDVMLVDEVLSVGDGAFRDKAFALMRDRILDGRSVVYVGHSLGSLRDLCDRALVMDRGSIRFAGAPGDAAAFYDGEVLRLGRSRPAATGGIEAPRAQAPGVDPPSIPHARFEDVVIVPYSDLMNSPQGGSDHRGGPLWPDWDQQTWARHQRHGRPVDVRPEDSEPAATWERPVAWVGPLVPDFGRQVADFGMRLYPTTLLWPEVDLAVSSNPRLALAAARELPSTFRELLRWFRIDPPRVRVVTEPVHARTVLVAAQAEQVGGPGPADDYLDRLDELVAANLPGLTTSGVLYVSRAGEHARFAGEAYLEPVLQQCGVTVIRPESSPLAEQLRRYAAAEAIVFAEGSALHALQLLGRNVRDIIVLCRRPGSTIAQASLAPRTRSLAYVDVTKGVIHGRRLDGRPAPEVGMSVLDVDVLLSRLDALGLSARQHWDQGAYHAQVESDVLGWAAAERALPRGRTPESLASIRSSLDTAGMGSLVARIADVEGPLPGDPLVNSIR